MSRRKNLKKLTALKTTAQKLKKMGRYGDTELVHLNKEEQKLIENYRGAKLSKNPKTGLKEGFEIATALAAISVVGGVAKATSSAYQAKKKARTSFDIGKMQIAAKRKQLEQQKKIQPEEAQAMANLRKGAERGTMDVQGLNRQMGQPMYQQGQAQQAQAMGQVTRQGLEGSVIAQEVSRKVGSDVRANIAEQARQISFQNEKSKAQAQERLQQALFKRGDLLRKIAGKEDLIDIDRQILSKQLEAGISQANIGMAGDVAGTAESAATTYFEGQEGDTQVAPEGTHWELDPVSGQNILVKD